MPKRGVFVSDVLMQDGHSNGLTAPNPAMQEKLLVEAYEDAARPTARVVYLEAHGTGTRLGDPIEIHAMSRALGGARRASGGPLCTASVKSNLGHLECGAGIASTVKAAMILQVRTRWEGVASRIRLEGFLRWRVSGGWGSRL